MEKIVLIKRTKEKRDKGAKITASLLLVALLALSGIEHLVEGIKSQTTCTGNFSCLIRGSGSIVVVFFGLFVLWFVSYLIYYKLLEWKKDKTNQSKRGRR